MWKAVQVPGTTGPHSLFDLYDPDGLVFMYEWYQEDIEYYLRSQRITEYTIEDLAGIEDVVIL